MPVVRRDSNAQGDNGQAHTAKDRPAASAANQPGAAASSAKPPPLPPTLYERLQAEVQAAQANDSQTRQQQFLKQIGALVRVWRISQGYNRLELATRLKMDPHTLLCLEQQIAQVDDINSVQVSTLRALMRENELDHQLLEVLNQYLAL